MSSVSFAKGLGENIVVNCIEEIAVFCRAVVIFDAPHQFTETPRHFVVVIQ
jgi:hypothetical protein